MLWKKMVRRLESASKPWARANGPAAVVYLSMKRVGIQMPAPFVMLFLEDGSTNLRSINLFYEAPETGQGSRLSCLRNVAMGETGCQPDGDSVRSAH